MSAYLFSAASNWMLLYVVVAVLLVLFIEIKAFYGWIVIV
jgi:hypothetical protein